jgi:acyl-CoA thioesterase FadM
MQETVRSVVKAWELDAVEHFTTAFYFRALSTASMRMLAELGWEASDAAAPWTAHCWTRFLKELNAGDAYHVLSGLVEAKDGGILLGHQLFNSETDELCTSFLQRLTGKPNSNSLPEIIDWPERASERRAEAGATAQWVETAKTVIRPEDLDGRGLHDLTALIHHSSDANVQVQNAIGMSSSYMRENRIGYSTAEYQLSCDSPPPTLGTALETRTTVAHIGRTSLWFLHEIHDASRDRPFATLAQFGVHLDMAARRPAPLPDSIRKHAQALMGR